MSANVVFYRGTDTSATIKEKLPDGGIYFNTESNVITLNNNGTFIDGDMNWQDCTLGDSNTVYCLTGVTSPDANGEHVQLYGPPNENIYFTGNTLYAPSIDATSYVLDGSIVLTTGEDQSSWVLGDGVVSYDSSGATGNFTNLSVAGSASLVELSADTVTLPNNVTIPALSSDDYMLLVLQSLLQTADNRASHHYIRTLTHAKQYIGDQGYNYLLNTISFNKAYTNPERWVFVDVTNSSNLYLEVEFSILVPYEQSYTEEYGGTGVVFGFVGTINPRSVALITSYDDMDSQGLDWDSIQTVTITALQFTPEKFPVT